MSNEFNICVPKTWEFVHSTVCKFFADNEIKYMFSKYTNAAGREPYAIYSINDEAIFTIMVYREAVFYDNEFDIILHFNGGGGDRALMEQWFQDLKNVLLAVGVGKAKNEVPLEIPKPANIACSPGECSFDDLM